MTVRSWSSAARCSRGASTTIVALALAVTACVPPVPESAPTLPTSEASRPSVPTTPSRPESTLDDIRQAVGPPAVDLAEMTLDLARRVDFVRHEVPRGGAQVAAISEMRELIGQVTAVAGVLEAAVQDIDAEAAPAVVAAARSLQEQAGMVADAVDTDLVALRPLVDFDVQSDAVVQGWGVRGSRSEIAARMDALVAQASALPPAAAQLVPTPPACPGTRDNRVRWAAVIAERTRLLRDLAVAAAGTAYDERRAHWTPAPYGEDRAAADAESRACWAAQTPLLAVPDEVQRRLDALAASLRG